MEGLHMYRDPKEFRDRFKKWKEGKPVYQAGLPLPVYDEGRIYSDDEAINYIIALENPHKIGWDKAKKIWRTPKGKGFDNNQIAYGLDTREEHNPLVYNFLKNNNRLNDPWLTDKEARNLAMQTYRQKKDSVAKAIEIAKGNVSQRGYNILSGMAWHGHPMKSVLSPDSITGKAFRKAIKQGDQDFDSVFDAYYHYGTNEKQFAERILADKSFRPKANAKTYVMTDGTKKMVFEKPDWAKSKVEIPNPYMPHREPPTEYPINPAKRNPNQYLNPWNGTASPSYSVDIPKFDNIQDINSKNQKEIQDVFEKAAVAYGQDKSILPSLSSLMQSPEEILEENRKQYFRDILNVPSLTADYSPTFHKFIIPKANRGKDKLPRFDEGTPYTVGPYNVYPSALDEQELLNVQTPNINIIGTDRRPLYQRYDASNSVYDPNAIRNITDWMPGIGDVSQGFDAVNAFKNNQYEQAALAGGLLLLPNALEPVVKPLVRGLSKFKNSIIGKITGNVPPPTYGNGSYAALSRRYEPEELKMFSKNNPIREYYGQNYDQYPEEIKKSIYNSVYNRMNIARNDSEFANDFANAFTQKYTTYSGEPFKHSFGGDMYGGMYFDNSDHIAIRDGKTDYALGHETVHQLDKKLGRTTKEKAFLEDAFDSDFLKGASEHERTTTNYDSRKRFLGNTIDSNSSLDVQNKIIDAATDDEVFDAVSKSNPYGKRYIEEKRKNGQLNSALANKIKESWKYVGMYGGAGGALYMQNDVTEEDLENAMREVGILAPLQSLGLYNKGKDIYIKPSKRGTFTAAAKKRGKSVQAFASQVLNNPGKYSKAMRKKAQFAKNASKWSH